MYKILFVTLVLLSASIKAETQVPDSGSSDSIQLSVAANSPQGNGKCYNRFGLSGWVYDKNCNPCVRGQHEVAGKCVDNTDSCVKGKYNTVTKSCTKCKFWYWMTKSTAQGHYCYNRWWMWVIIFFSGFVGLCLIGSAISYFTCCDDCCSKKQSKKSSKGKGGEVNVQNKKPEEKKKKESKGCCDCGGGDKKKKKGTETYDRGYEKPGFCDCMCCANTCGGCFGACGCTCSKCCRKKDRYVSGYGLSSEHVY